MRKDIFIIFICLALGIYGCSFLGKFMSKVDYLLLQIDRTINKLEKLGSDVKEELGDLDNTIGKTLPKEVGEEFRKIVQSAGVQIRCSSDYVKQTTICDLKDYRIKLLGVFKVKIKKKKYAKYYAMKCSSEPMICDMNPHVIHLESIDKNNNLLTIDGAFLNKDSINVTGFNKKGKKVNLNAYFSCNSRYVATLLLFDGNHPTIDREIKKIAFFNKRDISLGSSIQVISEPVFEFINSKTYGFNEGTIFNLRPEMDNVKRLSAMKIMQDNNYGRKCLSNIMLRWEKENNGFETSDESAGRIRADHDGGWINFGKNERIVYVGGSYYENNLIRYLVFQTSDIVTKRKKTYKFGKGKTSERRRNEKTNSGTEFSFTPPPNHEIIGFQGQANDYIRKFGVIYRKTIN